MKNFKHFSTLFISILLIFSGCTVETNTNQQSGQITSGSSDSGSSSEEDSKTSGHIIKTEKQAVTFSNTNANFTMIDISFIMIQTQRFQQKQENQSLEEECIFQVENFQII